MNSSEAMKKCEDIIDAYMEKAKKNRWPIDAMEATKNLSFEIWDVAYNLAKDRAEGKGKESSIRIPKATCQCGQIMSASADAFGSSVPSEGDISLCIGCGLIYMFNKDMTVRLPTEEEMKIVKQDAGWPKVERVRDLILKKHAL